MFFRKTEDVTRSKSNSNKTKHCPCLCQAISLVGILGRICGISPIVAGKHSPSKPCNFSVSIFWIVYSYIIQVTYIIYMIVAYGIKLYCAADPANVIEWYFITFGYFITDINSICSLLVGTLLTKRTCALYQKLSSLNSSPREMHYLKTFMNKFILITGCMYSITFSTYWYRASSKMSLMAMPDYCRILDFPFSIMVRGFTLIFPTVEQFCITAMCLVIRNKYKDLKTRTSLTCKMYSEINTSPEKQSLSSLKLLINDRRDVSHCLHEVNHCVGIQLLVNCVSCLYISIFYLYRYSTSRGKQATYEKIHCLIGLSYRTVRLVIYMILGQEISSYSQKPLKTLQNANLVDLPFRSQQQMQTLILQWSNKRDLLSCLGIVNMGLWLLAPIVGNVITYLLVALQFENHVLPNNVTAIFEYIF